MTRRVLVILSLSLLTIGAAACEDGTDVTTGEPTDGVEQTESPTVGTEDGMTATGDVTVEGTVGEVIADRAFTLTGAAATDTTVSITEDPLPVIVTDTAAVDGIRSQQIVSVTGTLHAVDLSQQAQDLEDALGITIDDSILSQFDARQVLLAESVSTDTTG